MPSSAADTSQTPAGTLPADRLEAVRTRRVLAFVLDYALVAALVVLGAIVLFFLGIVTLGLAWLAIPPLGIIVAICYVGSTMGGPNQATPGMRLFSLRIERDNSQPVDFITAVLHGLIFWAAHVMFTPLLLAVALFTEKKQLLQDVLLGTAIVRSDRA